MGILKNIFTVLILALILLFTFVVVVNVFWDATPEAVFTSVVGTILFFVLLGSTVYYFEHGKVEAQKKANDEYGRAIWLKAEAKRQAEKFPENSNPSLS